MLRSSHPEFAECVEKGIEMKILDSKIRKYPNSMDDIQNSLNADLVMAGTEIQLLLAAHGMMEHMNPDAVAPRLFKDFPHLREYVGPIVLFADKYKGGPFIADFAAFGQQCVNQAERRNVPTLWGDLASLPPGNAWAAIAFLKANLSCKPADVQDGVCRLVVPNVVRGMKTGDKKDVLMRTSNMLALFRRKFEEEISALSHRDKTKLLAHLDSWAAHFVIKNVAKVSFLPEDKQDGNVILEMSSLDQISNAAELLMMHLDSYPRIAGVVMPDLEAERKSAGKKEESARQCQLSDYDAEGNYIGEAKLLMQAGFITGTTLDFTSDQIFEGLIVAKTVTCVVKEVTQTHLTFQPIRKNAIKAHVRRFPHAKVRVLELGKGQPPTYLESWGALDWNLWSPMWAKSARRSEVLIALSTAQGLVRDQHKNIFCPEDYFQLQTAPYRSCIATRPMKKTPEDPSDIIALFPFTTLIAFGKKKQAAWCTTDIPLIAGEEENEDSEFIVLQPLVRVLPDNKLMEPPFIEPFWFVRLTPDAARANLKLGSWEGSVVSTVVLGDLGPKSRPTRFNLPMLTLARDVAEGEELCLLKAQPAKKETATGKPLKLGL